MLHQIYLKLLKNVSHLSFIYVIRLLHVSEIPNQPIVIKFWSLCPKNLKCNLNLLLLPKDLPNFLQSLTVISTVNIVVPDYPFVVE